MYKMWNKTTHSARPLRHSKKASFSCLSNCAVVIAFVQGGLLGTRSRCLFSWCFLIVIFSSWSDRRYGFWAEFVEAWIIFTFLRSWGRKINKMERWCLWVEIITHRQWTQFPPMSQCSRTRPGTAHFCEHLMFMVSKSLKLEPQLGYHRLNFRDSDYRVRRDMSKKMGTGRYSQFIWI